MEIAALAILGGAGYLLAKQTAPRAYPTKYPANPIVRPALKRQEGFANATVEAVKTSLRNNNPQLDLMFNDLLHDVIIQNHVLAGTVKFIRASQIDFKHVIVTMRIFTKMNLHVSYSLSTILALISFSIMKTWNFHFFKCFCFTWI